jgi:hypothetical protein
MPANPTALVCRIVRIERHSATPTATARPGDELILVLEIPAASFQRSLTVEILRGSERRDGRERVLAPSAEKLILTYRLHWRNRPDVSQRLTCRVSLDGRVLASSSVLLTPTADAQGRLVAPAQETMSDPTQVAYAEAFARLLRRRVEKPGMDGVPSEDGG